MRRLLLLLPLLLLPSMAKAQGIPISGIVVMGSNGQPRPGATLSFCAHPANAVPCTNYVNVYSDVGLTQLINQATTPIKTDGLGNQPILYTNPAIIDYTISGTGITTPNGPYVINVAPATNGNNIFTGTNKFSGAVLMGGGPIFDVTAPPFNADPTGVADSTTAIQSAITTAAGRQVYLPAGTYKTSADLVYSTCGDNPGIHMYGDGGLKSIINPTHANGWAIRLEGACVGQPGTFQRFGVITGIGIVPSAPGANTGGIKSTGNWYLWIVSNNINGSTGDCIQFPVRTDLNANADNYGNNYWHIEGNNLQHCGGFGFDQQDGPEGLGEFTGNNVVSNVLGGGYFTGEGNEIKRNTFSYNGNTINSLTTCAWPLAAGVLLDSGGGPGSVDSTAFEDNEFDANCYANLWVRRALGLRIGPNRQLQHTSAVANDGINRPRVLVRLDGVQTVESFQVTNQRVRGDFGTNNDQNLTVFQIQQAGAGNVSGGKVEDLFIAVGNVSANTTTFSVASGAIATVTQSGGVVQNTAVVVDGGAGYANTPACSIIDSGAGAGATCTAATTRGVVDVLLSASGIGYTTGATVAFSGGGCGVQATGSVVVNGNNAVSFIKLLTPGGGCTSIPTCTISPVGVGSGATCSAGIAFVVSSVTVTAGGANYAGPRVVINPGAADQGVASLGSGVTNLDIWDRVSNQAYFNVPIVSLPITAAGVIKIGSDIGISRQAASTFGFGNQTAGDISASIRAANFTAGGGSTSITIGSGQIVPGGVGTVDLGTTGNPFGSLWLSNGTNNYKFQPPTAAAPRVITWNDPLGASNLPFTSNTSTTTTQVLHATATAGLYTSSAIATADIATALTTPGPIGGTTPSTGKFTSMTATTLLWNTTAPTIAGAGCGGSAASIVVANGTAAFKINVGTAPLTACTITMPAATTGWNCFATDITTNSTTQLLVKQTGAESTTSVTLTNFSDVAAASNFTANDILKVACFAD